MKRIHLISGPRNISTALMYSFGNRRDTAIVDEPLYASYLNRHEDIIHPGREEILDSQSQNAQEVIDKVFGGLYEQPILFIKNMAHHLDDLDWSFILEMDNVFLIRDPKQLIASFAQVIEEPTLLDIGIEIEYRIFQYLQDHGKPTVVIDSNEVLKNPEYVLGKLCKQLGIPFDNNMISWKKGAREEDGVWAKYWYKNVHQSTGFIKQKSSDRPLPDRLLPLLNQAQKYYDLLCKHSIKATEDVTTI